MAYNRLILLCFVLHNLLHNAITDPIANRGYGFAKLYDYEYSMISSDLKIKYVIVASKILRPNTIYQIVASLASESEPCRFKASISRNGMAVSNNEAIIHSDQTQTILLKIPSGIVF